MALANVGSKRYRSGLADIFIDPNKPSSGKVLYPTGQPPAAFSPEWQNAMYERMAPQISSQVGESYARAGRFYSGEASAAEAEIKSQIMRDLALQGAEADREERLARESQIREGEMQKEALREQARGELASSGVGALGNLGGLYLGYKFLKPTPEKNPMTMIPGGAYAPVASSSPMAGGAAAGGIRAPISGLRGLASPFGRTPVSPGAGGTPISATNVLSTAGRYLPALGASALGSSLVHNIGNKFGGSSKAGDIGGGIGGAIGAGLGGAIGGPAGVALGGPLGTFLGGSIGKVTSGINKSGFQSFGKALKRVFRF